MSGEHGSEINCGLLTMVYTIVCKIMKYNNCGCKNEDVKKEGNTIKKKILFSLFDGKNEFDYPVKHF
jgi:hypothetical protein